MDDVIRWNHRLDFEDHQEFEVFLRAELARHGRFYSLSDVEFLACRAI